MTALKSHSHLKELEDEGIYVMHEVDAQFERPVLLFSGGKDSIVMFHLALKAFHPGKVPFPLMHVDTGHNFPETIEFRDSLVEKYGVDLIVGSVQDSIDEGRVEEETGPDASRNALQTVTLLDTLKKHQVDAALGGGRRDEEKARAKERFFRIGIFSGNGIQKTSVLSFGIYSMEEKNRAKISVYSQFPTGQKWMCGSISRKKKSKFHPFILHTSVKYLTVVEFG